MPDGDSSVWIKTFTEADGRFRNDRWRSSSVKQWAVREAVGKRVLATCWQAEELGQGAGEGWLKGRQRVREGFCHWECAQVP